ncbi:MAG: hypothetical protein CL677_05055 [Bdellovibrionaceae bacterium]|nr:hypothetical protein [Pseudobdellovibrionaceae bacterium]|tara:strand:+ start:101495 stop:102163 length:669 start_codon:yes stop_codon:yes gene_type:complete
MSPWTKSFVVILLFLLSAGCLRTRADIQAEDSKMQELQQEKATLTLQLQEMQEDMRGMIGRIDGLETQLQDQQSKEQEETKEADKFKLFEEALLSIEKQLREIKEEVKKVQEDIQNNKKAIEKNRLAKAKKAKEKIPKGNYARGSYYYSKKDWRKAIGGFREYRKLNPNGRRYLDATFKIGVAFHELGMSTEAKVFYDEVIAKSPKSKEAKKARIRLQALSK